MNNHRPPRPSKTKIDPANFKPIGSPIEHKFFPINRDNDGPPVPETKKRRTK